MIKELKIGGHIWKIEYKELDEKLGETDWNKQTIFIEQNMSEDMKVATLIHEVLHCCNPTLDSSELGHALIDSLAEQLYQVVADNNLFMLK